MDQALRKTVNMLFYVFYTVVASIVSVLEKIHAADFFSDEFISRVNIWVMYYILHKHTHQFYLQIKCIVVYSFFFMDL